MGEEIVPFGFICTFALKKEVDMELRFDWWRWLVTILVGFFIMLMMYGCRTTRYVEVEKVVRDYLRPLGLNYQRKGQAYSGQLAILSLGADRKTG